jgi:hypothetical protein
MADSGSIDMVINENIQEYLQLPLLKNAGWYRQMGLLVNMIL